LKLPRRKIRSVQLSTITWDNLYEHTSRLQSKEQVVKDLLNSQIYFDPTLKTLICLMEAPEEMVRRFTEDYCKRVESLHRQRLLTVRSCQHYRNVSQQQKILEVVMRQLDWNKKSAPSSDWDSFFNDRIDSKFNRSLLEVSYNLIFVGVLQLRVKLLNILNAQNCLEKNIVADLGRLVRSNMPY